MVVAFSMSAAAQVTVSRQQAPVDLSQVVPQKSNLKMTDDVLKMTSKKFVKQQVVAKAEEENSIYGAYIFNEMRDDISCSALDTLVAIDVTDADNYKYNVQFNWPGYRFDPIVGNFDASTQTLTIPSGQVIFKSDDYEAAFFGFAENQYVNEVHMKLNEDGSFEMEEDGWQMVIVTEGHKFEGYYIVSGNDERLLKPNARQGAYSTLSGGWPEGDEYDYIAPAYVEDWGESVNVFNFCDYGQVAIDINEDLTVSLAPGQIVDNVNYTEVNPSYGFDFGYFKVVALDENETSLVHNGERAIVGVLSGNRIMLDGYFSIRTNYMPNVGCVSYGNFVYWQVMLSNGNFQADGIEEVTASREEIVKNTKTFNLMGQQVNRADAAKGMLIRGGKKYIKK